MFIEVPAPQSKIAARGLVYSKGVNDAPYNISYKTLRCPIYEHWKGILHRCYDTAWQERYPSYKGCSVDAEWLVFTNFRAWVMERGFKGLDLDKDLIVVGNKVYSATTCSFIPRYINLAIQRSKCRSSTLPTGVHLRKYTRYAASISILGKKYSLGCYSTIEEAADTYLTAKASYIYLLGDLEPSIRKQLRDHAEQLIPAIGTKISPRIKDILRDFY